MGTLSRHRRSAARPLPLALLALPFAACVPDITSPDRTPSYVERLDRVRVACRRVDREASPLEHVEVVAARPIAGFEGRPRVHRVRGARLLIRPPRAMTADELQRWSTCHIERSGLLAEPERSVDDPLAVRGVTAEVRPSRDGFELWLTATRHDDGAEVYRRALQVVD